MVVEILSETQSWPIDLPDEDVFVDRLLVASRDGTDVARWRYNGTDWTCIAGGTPSSHTTRWRHNNSTSPTWVPGKAPGAGVGIQGWPDAFAEIVGECMKCQYTLHSVPKPE